MLYQLLRLYARVAIKLYCRKIIINKPEFLQQQGPLLLAANHPNSFLDGIILSTLFRQPIYSLARGDVFRNSKIARLLRQIFLLPVYRTTEGVENLPHNYSTFAACKRIFKRNGIVLMFSEGGTKNEWHLRPLRKGTARLSISAWNDGIDLNVVPVALNYSSFRKFGKVVHLYFGSSLNQKAIVSRDTEGKKLNEFNHQIRQQLLEYTYEISSDDRKKRKQLFYVRSHPVKAFLLVIPAIAGFLVHAPLFLVVIIFTEIFFNNDHYDSVVTTLFVLLYPAYILVLTLFAFLIAGWMGAIATFIFTPFCAWAYVHIKHYFDF